MLEAIFGSESRVKIINFFLLSDEKKYQLAQLAKILNIPTSHLRREIDNLVKFGLIKEEIIDSKPSSNPKQKTELKPGHKLIDKNYYSVNTAFILYQEIKALFVKSQLLFGQKFIANIQKVCQAKFLALTGIFTNDTDARTDILVVGNLKKPIFLKLIQELEKGLGREINFTLMDEKEFYYREAMMDIFLYSILDGKTIILLDNLHKTKAV